MANISKSSTSSVELHRKKYRLPTQPTVVVCVDGYDPEYFQSGILDGSLPFMASWVKSGFSTIAKCAMPSLTNPNNLSIITGVPTAVHGIAGNYYLDRKTGEEHMITDGSLMRGGSTILEQMANAGVRVAAITAKDKLRKIINHGLTPQKGAICFSSQNAKECTQAEHGISNVEEWLGREAPSQYSPDLSLFVLDAGVKLLQQNRADLFYLTLSDFVQHKYAPGSPEATKFMQGIDDRVGQLQKLGAVVAITGDHGMSDKADKDGNPNVLFLEDFLNSKWPDCGARVICPIADPFVKHHGALGGFVRVYLTNRSDDDLKDMLDVCGHLPQVELALSGEEAAARFEMPADREGDFVVVATENAVIGARENEHDLLQLRDHRLRSHGGLSEQAIPLIRSTPVAADKLQDDKQWRNFDIFDLVLNY